MIVITTDVFCDDCGDWIHGTTEPRVQRGEARRVARSEGWTCTPAGDFCPGCRGET